jgi:NDP-sugar pyrophosphorylase family protein
LAGHGAKYITDYFGTGGGWGVEIETVVEDRPLGTAGSFNLIRDRLTEPFLVLYGDILFDIDAHRFVQWARQRAGAGCLYVHPNNHPFDSDLVDVDSNDRIVRFVSKPHEGIACGNLVSAALYWLVPEALDCVPMVASEPIDWGRDVFPKLVSRGMPLYAYRGTEYLHDIGTPERLERSLRAWKSGKVGRRSYCNRQAAISSTGMAY